MCNVRLEKSLSEEWAKLEAELGLLGVRGHNDLSVIYLTLLLKLGKALVIYKV